MIRKERYCFTYDYQYFQLDVFTDIDLSILEVELTEETQEVSLPEFLEIKKDVTEDPSYNNEQIAERV